MGRMKETVKNGVIGVSLAIFVMCGIFSIIALLVLFWEFGYAAAGVIAILGMFGLCNFMSLIYNLMKISQPKRRKVK